MDNYYDVNYEEVGKSEKPPQTYYSIGEVGKEIGEETSTVRHWTNQYWDLLDVEYCNTHRRYTRLDIEKLKVIKKCIREKKMKHNQVINVLNETNFDISVIEKHIGDMQKPLDIQILASAICVEMENRFALLEESIIDKINLELDKRIEKEGELLKDIRMELSTTVDEVVSEKLSELKQDYNITNEALKEVNSKLDELKMAHISLEEIKNASYKEGFGRKLYKLLFGNR